jgi:2-polyprenyl-3-methyl-5-hydroxy-6-metoxy-1,4-benzoquinol methylase
VHDESVSEEQDGQFHRDLDEGTYVAYFAPFRKRQYRHVLAKLDPEPGLRLLDIGASYGWMLEVGAEFGLDSHGLEPSPMGYESELQGRITSATLQAYAADSSDRFELITLWHVLEHLRDPFAALRDVRDLLQPGGRAIIAVPNAAGRMYKVGSVLARRFGRLKLMEELWYTHNPNMHRYYPTLEALIHMLHSAQLRVVDSYTLEAFDWHTIWTRGSGATSRSLLRVAGPVIGMSRFTAAENLIIVVVRE